MDNQKIASTPRKKRSRNFSADEENTIQSMVEANWAVITEKHSTEVTKKRKNNAWSEIVREVNSKGVAPRSLAEVKEKWTNMTRKAKKTYTDYRIQSRKTGGGPPPPEPSQATSRIIDIMRDSASFDGVPDGLETECIPIECEASLPDTAAVTSEPSVTAYSETPVVDSPSHDPCVPSTPQPEVQASSSKSPDEASASNTSGPPSDKRRRPSSEKVLELQQQVLSGELDLQKLQFKKLKLQIKLLEDFEKKQYSEDATPTQMLLALMQ